MRVRAFVNVEYVWAASEQLPVGGQAVSSKFIIHVLYLLLSLVRRKEVGSCCDGERRLCIRRNVYE